MATDDKSSRRDLLKRALIVLGAGVLVQPNGGVSGSAFADTMKDKTSPLAKSGSKVRKPFNKTGSQTSKAGATEKSADKISGNAKTPQ